MYAPEPSDCLKMILELFAANRDAFLDHEIGFDLGKRVALDSVRRVSQLKGVSMFEVCERVRGQRARAVELGFLCCSILSIRVSSIA